MPSRSNSNDERDAQPLLGREAHNGHVIFTVTDDDGDETTREFDRVALHELPPPPLRSTMSSREAGKYLVCMIGYHATC